MTRRRPRRGLRLVARDARLELLLGLRDLEVLILGLEAHVPPHARAELRRAQAAVEELGLVARRRAA